MKSHSDTLVSSFFGELSLRARASSIFRFGISTSSRVSLDLRFT